MKCVNEALNLVRINIFPQTKWYMMERFQTMEIYIDCHQLSIPYPIILLNQKCFIPDMIVHFKEDSKTYLGNKLTMTLLAKDIICGSL